MQAPWKPWTRRIALCLAGAILLCGAWIVYGICKTLRGLPDAYAKWDAGDLVVDYLRAHPDKWPAGWEDLRPSFGKLSPITSGDPGRMRGGLTFDAIRSRIGIDWSAHPADLARFEQNEKAPPFRVIWALDGSSTTWSDAEPNEMVLDYLRNGSPAKATMPSSTARYGDPAIAPEAGR